MKLPHSKKLFLIDTLGAFISMILLGLVVGGDEPFFGMPTETCYFLAFLAGIFMVYSLLSYAFVKALWKKFLRGIAIINLSYCVLTVILLVIHSESLSVWGWGYFVGEIIIVTGLALFEFRISKEK